MQKLYTASFNLGSLEGAGPSLVDVAEACRAGLVSHPQVVELALSGVRLAEPASLTLGVQTWCDIHVADVDGSAYWALCLEYIDPDDSISRWRTTFCARRDPDEATVFACTVSVGAVSSSAIPMDIAPRRPQPIVDLLRCLGGFKGAWNVSHTPRQITTNDVLGLVTAIESSGRHLPLVHADVAPATGFPAADAAVIADELAGIAHVSFAADTAASEALARLLPQELRCRPGAVRVYWPQPYLTRQGSDTYHPVAGQSKGTLGRRLLNDIVGKTLHVDDPEAPDLSILELEARRPSDTAVDDASVYHELARLFASENDELLRLKKEQSRRLDELAEDLERTRDEAESWKSESERLARLVGPRAISLPSVPRTVSEAIEMARIRHADKLVFATNNRSREAACPYRWPKDVLQALEFLATTYRDARLGIASCPDFDQEIQSSIGWNYRSGQSPRTVGAYPEWYVTTWERRRFTLGEHLAKGTSRDPHRTIRIGFAWDPQTKKVVIGYIGQHQRTTKS